MSQEYTYQLRNEQGYFMYDIVSPSPIHVDMLICYNNKKMVVLEKNSNTLIVRKISSEVEVSSKK